MMMAPNVDTLQVRDLNVSYRTERGALAALRDVNMAVPSGKIVGLVGESGCGKSTVIAAIMGLLAPNADIGGGSILYKGEDLMTAGAKRFRDLRGTEITMVFQDPMQTLNPVLSVGRQMTDIQYRTKRSGREKRQRAVEMLAQVGISDPDSRLDQYSHEFSGGMRQRIAIAMALMVQPALLIADEPTTALDATLEVQIIKLLKSLQEDVGCSILFISHHLGVIAELCDEVVVMYAGEVVEQGRVADVFREAAHPYTRLLLECDPGRIPERTRVLPTIPGEVPDLRDVPDGCLFKARCPKRFDTCDTERPAWFEIDPSHHAACHLVADHGSAQR